MFIGIKLGENYKIEIILGWRWEFFFFSVFWRLRLRRGWVFVGRIICMGWEVCSFGKGMFLVEC